jgi:hypothetical protein
MCALTRERIIGPFSVYENIVTSRSFQDILEDIALPQLTTAILFFN